jgi:uncharacterized phage infection (PIP) family protein YhgE
MFVKKVSANALRDFQRNYSKEVPTNNSPDTPLKNDEGKRPRLEVSSSPPVQIPGNNQPSSSEGVDEMWTSFVPKINSSGDIDKHFIKEEFQDKVEELELEKVLQASLTDSVRSNFHLRVLAGKFRDMEKKNKTYVAEISELQKKLSENEKNYVGEINELKKKLSEYEKKMAEMTSLKDERNKLKKALEESSLERSRLLEMKKHLMKDNFQSRTRLLIKEDGHKVTVGKLKAEIEELKGENSEQYRAGYNNAVRQMVFFASGLKP